MESRPGVVVKTPHRLVGLPRIKQVGLAEALLGAVFLHKSVPGTVEPVIKGNFKTFFRQVRQLGHVALKQGAQDAFLARGVPQIVRRKASGKGRDAVIQQRIAAFKPHMHGSAVHFEKDILREPIGVVQLHHQTG